ncbi:DUF4395 domain-containing protein [Aquiluna borgnonia]|uniref:DUF4395 domain-containing protein n=1 Tax=Aquiluna borgnonia TaxID=2499157 RepID=A0A7D4UK32_9MICO|nr:DUF4395 domain-containing protein [Aquiluna borgnonia]QKJ25459.1 DUF4395 domain-containing protein [Aquiluna borgnonia]
MSNNLIDPRGPRFGAAITSVISLTAFFLATSVFGGPQIAYWLILLLTVLFSWSVISPPTHPYASIFKSLVRPRLRPPIELEDPRPPQFAQKVGLGFALFGTLGGIVFGGWAITLSAGFIFVAAFLNAAFNFCLGCQMYLGLRRVGILKK